jgi:uncharacterized membrane protein YhiD involved in acid resistance
MDTFTLLFWLGLAILIGSHVPMLSGGMRTHALIALAGTALMFVGSKIGRAALGLA